MLDLGVMACDDLFMAMMVIYVVVSWVQDADGSIINET